MISQIYYTVGYPAKIPNPYQKNGMVSDPIYIIPGYDMILLDMEYPMKYIISFRLVNRKSNSDLINTLYSYNKKSRKNKIVNNKIKE